MSGEQKKARLSSQWLHACSGCEVAILDNGESFIDLLQTVDLVHMPVLMDNKYHGSQESTEICLPEAEIGLVSGGCANTEHEELLKEMRRKCKTLIALGTCATHGGIPAMANMIGVEQVYAETFSGEALPAEGLPEPLDRVYALDEIVDIDLLIPGCPPRPEYILQLIINLLSGDSGMKGNKSVCDTCSAKRTGKHASKKVKRLVDSAEYDPAQEIDTMRCLLEQGLLCMGPVTASGCAGTEGPPCIHARVPCRGCFGPVRKGGNQMMDMMNALVSKNIDYKSIVDRKNMLRFAGAHNRLRPIRTKGKS